MNVIISNSTRNNKRLMAQILDGRKVIKTIHFGSQNPKYGTYIEHQDNKMKEAYIKRHRKNEDWTDPFTAGFWSRWLLWSKPTLKESLREAIKQSKGKIKNVVLV